MYDASLYTLIGIPNLSIGSHLFVAHRMVDSEKMVCKPRCSPNDYLYADYGPHQQEVPFQISRVALRLPCSTLFITPDGAKHRSTEVWSHWFQRHCAVPALF